MAKRKRNKYSALERKAYWVGVGAGISGGDISSLIDTRLGTGQNEKLCASARKGIVFGRKNRFGVPFDQDKKYSIFKENKTKRR